MRRHRPRLAAIVAAALAAASSSSTAFRPPSLPPARTFRGPPRVVVVVVDGGRSMPSPTTTCRRPDRAASASSSGATTTSLCMVFDFFKKAQTEASEQMSAFATGLAKSRNQVLYGLEDAFVGGGGNLLDDLEDTLLQADLGLATTEDVLEEARFLREESTDIFGRDDVRALLRGKLLEALGASAGGTSSGYSRVRARAGDAMGGAASGGSGGSGGVGGAEDGGFGGGGGSFALRFADEGDDLPISAKRPLTVHFVMGANGMGKTTTIGKLAHRLRTEAGKRVLLAACDTYRAGAVAQLEKWAERAGVDCHPPSERDVGPSAVLYGALDRAIGGEYDVLLVDTSGRLSNNDALTAELVKMKRVIQKRMSTGFDESVKPVPNVDVPHETLLVIDAAQGRIALDSAKQWDKELGLTGLILTKLDGSAKGGSVVAVSRELGLPVKLVGVGEGMGDLKDFDPESFVDGLLGIGIAGGGKSKSEGKALASRLTQMRKERNERAKMTVKKELASSPLTPGGGGGMMAVPGDSDGIGAENSDTNDVELVIPGGGSVSRGKPKNKKKKKGKR